MNNVCLFLKPEVKTPEGRDKQREDIETFIRPAIEQAGLSAIDDQFDGLEVSDISDEIIQKIYEADVIVIDANRYETSEAFEFSPYLYYYMAIGHSLGNATILVTNTKANLPHKLITYHTLPYSVKEFRSFINKFKATVEEIQQPRIKEKPDNPIQEYLQDHFNEEALAKAQQQIAELKAEKAQQKQGKRSITFRRVE